jgi:hypothetical protein
MVSRYAHLAPHHLPAAVERLVSPVAKDSNGTELARNYPDGPSGDDRAVNVEAPPPTPKGGEGWPGQPAEKFLCWTLAQRAGSCLARSGVLPSQRCAYEPVWNSAPFRCVYAVPVSLRLDSRRAIAASATSVTGFTRWPSKRAVPGARWSA